MIYTGILRKRFDANCILTGGPTLADVVLTTETSMSINVTWTINSHGNNPPVEAYVIYQEEGSSDYFTTTTQETCEDDISMSANIDNLNPNTTYHISVVATNQKRISNTTTQNTTATTRCKFITFSIEILTN